MSKNKCRHLHCTTSGRQKMILHTKRTDVKLNSEWDRFLVKHPNHISHQTGTVPCLAAQCYKKSGCVPFWETRRLGVVQRPSRQNPRTVHITWFYHTLFPPTREFANQSCLNTKSKTNIRTCLRIPTCWQENLMQCIWNIRKAQGHLSSSLSSQKKEHGNNLSFSQPTRNIFLGGFCPEDCNESFSRVFLSQNGCFTDFKISQISEQDSCS